MTRTAGSHRLRAPYFALEHTATTTTALLDLLYSTWTGQDHSEVEVVNPHVTTTEHAMLAVRNTARLT